MAPHVYFLSFFSRPVPVREYMQHVFITPPRLVIVEIILWKAARINYTEMRAYTRPAIRRWFPAVVKTCPYECPEYVWPFHYWPQCLFRRMRPLGLIDVIRAHITFFQIIYILSPCGNRASGLAAVHGHFGKFFAERVVLDYIVIKSLQIYYIRYAAAPPAVHGRGYRPGWVEFVYYFFQH